MDHSKRLKRLHAQIMANRPAQSLLNEFGPAIERWVASEPENPNPLKALAWLNWLREEVRKADARTYAGRKLPESLTRLLER